jgi:hypothetical protein
MKFKDVVIYINGVAKFASEATLSQQGEVSRVPELYLKKVSSINSSRIAGSFSATYYLNNNDSDIRALTGINICSGGIGDVKFENALMKNYSINVTPYDVMQASVSFDFYTPMSTGIASPSIPSTGVKFGHGSYSDISSIIFNNNPFEFNYSLEQTITPSFSMGDHTAPIQFKFEQGQENCSLKGRSVASALEFCGDSVNLVLNIKNTCNSSLGTIGVSGLKVTDEELSLTNDENLTSTVSLIRYF